MSNSTPVYVASDGWPSRRTRVLNRLHARLSSFGHSASAFVSQPQPRTIGSFARGRQLSAGNIQFAGDLIESPDCRLWQIRMPSRAFEQEAHGFAWLDDLAAVGDLPARQTAQKWIWEWIAKFGRGGGPGWTADLTGRRLIRWVNHAIFVLNGQ